VNTPEMTGSLMFVTLGIGALVAIVALLWFLRKPANRHPLSDDEPIIPRSQSRRSNNKSGKGQY
jgi:hypothetical protein